MTNMKCVFARLSAVMTAAVCAVSAALPVSAAYTSANDSFAQFTQNCPLVYQSSNGARYYSNWYSEVESDRAIALYRASTSRSVLHCEIMQQEIDVDAVEELLHVIFDDSYTISFDHTLVYGGTEDEAILLQAYVYDDFERPETEEKADQLFETLNGQYTFRSYYYDMGFEIMTRYISCDYICDYSGLSFEEREQLRAFLAENYPEWEIREILDSYHKLRKKNIERMYDVPIEEYLAMQDTIYKEFDFSSQYLFYPEDERIYIQQTKYYLGGSGDLNEDGELSTADGVLLARVVAEDDTVSVTASGLQEADVNCDGYVTVTDVVALLSALQ